MKKIRGILLNTENKKILIKKIIYLIILLVIISGITIYYLENKTEKVETIENSITQKDSKKKVYEHTFAERISKKDFFRGTFIANDIASVFPRRDALVRDILVDIGDKVRVGQTLAILFNPGVGGEGQSKINIKGTIVSTQKNILNDLEKVKEAKINEIDQKIIEKEILLRETINNFDTKIAQVGDYNSDDKLIGSEYQVQIKGLENLQKNLENAKKVKEELLKDSRNNIIQKEKLLVSKIDELYNKIIPILYIGTSNELNYNTINTHEFSEYFGAKNTSLKNNFYQKIKIFNYNHNGYDVGKKYNDFLEINNLLIEILQNTITSVEIPENLISTYIGNINTYNNAIITQKEVLDDSKNMLNILKVGQEEKINNIETNISKKENEISLLVSKGNSIEAEKQLSTEKIKASIETLKKSKDLLIANENKGITILKNSIEVSKANLNNEYIKSGDYKIISPFSGIVSKRGIEMGEKISQNTEAFRLVGVNNTLSRITKKEIKFSVPESLKDNLEINKEIKFYFGDKNEKSFTGTIYRIAPEIDEKTLSITVQAKVSEKVSLPNKSTVRVSFETKEDIFRVPSSSIYNKGERKIMYYKKDNGKLGVRDINIISEDGEFSLVSGEFDENLRIVTTPIFIK